MALVRSPEYVNQEYSTYFGIKRAKVIIFTNYKGSLCSFGFAQNGYLF